MRRPGLAALLLALVSSRRAEVFVVELVSRLPVIAPIETSDLIETSLGSLIFWRPATAFIAPMKHAE